MSGATADIDAFVDRLRARRVRAGLADLRGPRTRGGRT
jgi:hypothetical protein